jgi:hypothetical protein
MNEKGADMHGKDGPSTDGQDAHTGENKARTRPPPTAVPARMPPL